MDLDNISNVDSAADIYYIDWDEKVIVFVKPFNEIAKLVEQEFRTGLELLRQVLQEFFELDERAASTMAHLISILILGLTVGSLAISRSDPVAFEFDSEDNVTVQYSLRSFLS